MPCDSTTPAATPMPARPELQQHYLAIAERLNLQSELCTLRDYDPKIGQVPPHWTPTHMQFFEEAVRLGIELANSHQTHTAT